MFDGINVLVAQFNGESQVFSVESNSTVTGILYNPEDSELNLTVTGQTGTTGFVDVYISKCLVGDVSAIQAYIDGNPVSYTVTPTEDSWILHFYYHHSSHNITFDLSEAGVIVPELPQTALPLIMVCLVALTVAMIALKKETKSRKVI